VYHVAKIRNYFEGQGANLAGVKMANSAPLTIAEAIELVAERERGTYTTISGEYARPDYLIITDRTRAEIESDDMSKYNWEDYPGDDPDNDDDTYIWRCQREEALAQNNAINKGGSVRLWAAIDTCTRCPESIDYEYFIDRESAESSAYRAWLHYTEGERRERVIDVAQVTLDEEGLIDFGVGYTPSATLAVHDDDMTWEEAGEYIRRNPRATLYAARYDGSVWSAGRKVEVGEVISCHLTRAAASAACTDYELSSDFDREHLTTSVEEITADDFYFGD